MDFILANTFQDSLNKLNNDEKKAAKTAVMDLQLDPGHPGLHYHKLDRAQDPRFASIRVTRDIRVIVHKSDDSMLICYVDHHDKAYEWAQRRKLETHPKTGAAQLVEIRERVEERIIPKYIEVEQPAPPKPPIFRSYSDDELLGYGVPEEWLPDVRQATEDTVLDVISHLPEEAEEALLQLASGGKPKEPVVSSNPFEHPDAQRRFRRMGNSKELEMALDYPWEKWTTFLHPDQRSVVEKDFNGPARVSGSAGTGKTIVALHRAVHLAKQHQDARILLTTFSEPLANNLRNKLRCLLTSQPHLQDQIEIYPLEKLASRLYRANRGKSAIISRPEMEQRLLKTAASMPDLQVSRNFVMEEWFEVVDAWQLFSWEEYRDVRRLGRKTRLPEARRRQLWDLFVEVQQQLKQDNLATYAELYRRLSRLFTSKQQSPYDFIIVDECQDISIPQLRFVVALGSGQPNNLFFAGDLGQRIFQTPFSWKSLGVDVRGRSKTLRINYRTSHQIRRQADRLLDPEIADVDGNIEKRKDTISVFDGPEPIIRTFETPKEETTFIGEWLTHQIGNGVAPEELALFVRSEAQIPRAEAVLNELELAANVLDEHITIKEGAVSIATMHLAKGMEFRGVAVMACDDEVIPSPERMGEASDESDMEEVFNTERHLLYVACTRARDQLVVTGVEPASDFLEDMMMDETIKE